MLVAAIGTRPGIEFSVSAGLRCNKGILVDEFLKTSAENIYAAGDVTEPEYGIPGGCVSPYIWPNAMAQGKCAAMNLAGNAQAFGGTGNAQNMVQLRDMQFVSMGMVKPRDDGYEVVKAVDPDGLIYKKFILRNNIVTGMILIGDVKKANALSGLIRKSTDASAFKGRLTEPDFTP
jgi:nitrite reductase (NADH) large subunit